MSRGTGGSERRRCAPVLNRELEGHTSSLWAIRTEHTRDLTAQLIRYLRHGETSTSPPQPERGRQSRDQWTRWPLPDAPQSDWDLEDEIGVIVRHEFANKRGNGGIENYLDDEEEDYIDQLVQHLRPILIQFLESILVLVEQHTVLRPPSLQDRINPLTWCDLANILASPAARDLIDGRMLRRYVDRMESILGSDGPSRPSVRRAIQRRDMFDQLHEQRQVLDHCLMTALF